MSEANTGGGAGIGGNVNTGGGDLTGRDVSRNEPTNNVSISLENRDKLEIIDYKLTRLNDNFIFQLSRLEDQIGNRLRNVERDIEQMRRDIEKTQTDGEKTREDVNDLKNQSIVLQVRTSTQPVASNGNLKRIFWALVGLGFIVTVLLSVLIVILTRGAAWLP